MNSSINVLYLDIGGVLLTNGWGHQSRQKAAEKFGFDYNTMNELNSIAFDIYESGKMSLDDYLDTVLFYEPRNFSKEDFKQFMYSESKPLPQLLEWLIAWKQRHPQVKIFSINNEPKELHQYRVETYQLRRLFDGFICSCDVRLRKPDPQIYTLALAIAAATPEECIYIDDREVLVRAGAKCGLQARVHKTFEETSRFLESI